jgi:glycosyltransferase involved in cell wall biosynthesis
MRILVTSPYLPWPLWSGGNAAQFSTLRCLAQDHEFTLVCPVYSEAQRAHACELQEQLSGVRLRVVFCGARRPAWAVRGFRRGVRVAGHLLRPWHGRGPAGSASLLPAYPFGPLPAPFIEALQEELERGPDLCQAEFAEMLPLGAWFPASVPKVFIHHQVHFVYAQRLLKSQGRTSYGSYLEAVMRIQEVALLRCFDRVIVFGEPDRLALTPHLERSKVSVSPFPIPADVGLAGAIPPQFDGRFLFIGSEEHGPNRAALAWLLAEIWPQIARRLPAARLAVIGRWPAAARAASVCPGVSFSGFVQDLGRALDGGILLVPLQIGSGIRTKILAALARGVPAVTTPVGVEGLALAEGCGCLVRAGAADFAAAAVQLAREPELRRRVAAAGLAAVTRAYCPASVRQRRNEIYETTVKTFWKRDKHERPESIDHRAELQPWAVSPPAHGLPAATDIPGL